MPRSLLSLSLTFGPFPLAFGIRLPSLSRRIPGLQLQVGTLLLEVFYEFDDVNLELPGGRVFYWSRKVGGWLEEDA